MNLSRWLGVFGVTQSDSGVQHLPAAEAVGTPEVTEAERRLQHDIVRLQGQLESKQKEIHKLNNSLAKVNLPASKLNAQIKFRDDQITRYQNREEDYQRRINSLRIDNARITSHLQKAQDSMMSLTRGLSMAKEENDLLEKENDELRKTKSSSSSSQSEEINRLRLAWAVEKQNYKIP